MITHFKSHRSPQYSPKAILIRLPSVAGKAFIFWSGISAAFRSVALRVANGAGLETQLGAVPFDCGSESAGPRRLRSKIRRRKCHDCGTTFENLAQSRLRASVEGVCEASQGTPERPNPQRVLPWPTSQIRTRSAPLKQDSARRGCRQPGARSIRAKHQKSRGNQP